MAHDQLRTYYETYPAMGSVVKICLTSSMDQAEADRLLHHLKKEIMQFEKRCSRFLPASELSRFNQKAGTKQGVTPQLLSILTKARDIGIRTEGLYNPFILPALQRVGYLHSVVPDYANDPTNDYSSRVMTPVTNLEVGDGWARIPYNTAIDLGGCGKGYIGDLLADIIDTHETVKGYWLSMGGDIVARGIHESGLPIAIGISDEHTGKIIARMTPDGMERYAVATSTTLRRQGIQDGVSWHHIIDPRTARPADSDLPTVSVVHPFLFDADVHATNCIILGSPKVPYYLREHKLQDALLQPNKGKDIFIGEHIKRYVDTATK